MKASQKNIHKLALIGFFSSLYFYLPVLTIYYQSRGLNFVQINLLWGIITATIFLAEIPTGVIADKLGRKKSIVIALALQLLGEVIFLGAQNYAHFVVISIIAGVGFAFQSGCLQAMVYDSLKENKKEKDATKSFGLLSSLQQAGHLVGALASSVLVMYLLPGQITLAIILTATAVGIALLISLFLHEPEGRYAHAEESPFDIIKQSITVVRGNPQLKKIVAVGLFTTPFVGYLRNFHPPYFEQVGLAPWWLGLSLALGGGLAVVASKYAYILEKKFEPGRGLLAATLIPGVLYIFMGFIIDPVMGLILFVLNFGLLHMQDPILAEYYNRHIATPIRATVLSSINMLSSFYIAIMGLVFGLIADKSLSGAFFLMGAIIVISAIGLRIRNSPDAIES